MSLSPEEPNKSVNTPNEVNKDDNIFGEQSSETPSDVEQMSENVNVDKQSPPNKKRKLSPLPAESDSNKISKSDTGQDASVSSSAPSDLSTGSSRENLDTTSTSNQSTDNTTVVTEHYNALEEKGLSQRNQSRIVYMRNFNNWIKSMLIGDYLSKVKQNVAVGSPLKVLDMCCGKGGDLLKWKKGGITHLICTDIANISIEQCRNRYEEMLKRSANTRGFDPLYTAEFIAVDSTKIRLREKYKDITTELDLVSCQFAVHYSFETLQQAECMMRNASESLRPGGYFIGTVPDAYDLVSRWQKNNYQKFGNEVYTVEFFCDKKPPLFGAKYHFHLEGVVDCPEFLVHLPTFCKLAEKFGLELIMFERFDKYYEHTNVEGRSLLSKMQALETYPPFHEAPLLGQNTQEYQHAVQYMHNSPGHRKIGTLSQSEWEAISLYAVFAFRKMKKVRSNDGKEEYVKVS